MAVRSVLVWSALNCVILPCLVLRGMVSSRLAWSLLFNIHSIYTGELCLQWTVQWAFLHNPV
eukprot:3442504-Lingulodinium_polyedra.AAC.1